MQKYIETQEDLEPIRLSRFKMEKFVHLPIFKKLVMNCFVRIGIGQYQGRSVYVYWCHEILKPQWVCRVKEFKVKIFKS